MATIDGVDFLNRKQLRKYAQQYNVSYSLETTSAALIALLKAA